MSLENIGIVILFVGAAAAFVFASMEESQPLPDMTQKLVYTVRVPASSPITP